MPRCERAKISENEMAVIRKGIPKEGTYNKYGGADREVEIESIGEMGHSGECLSREFREGSLIERRLVYTAGGISRFPPTAPKHAPMLAKIEN